MITLSSERGLERVETWDDVTAIPGFTDRVDHKAHKLVAIIGRYVLPEPVQCGLASCRQSHRKGFVVSIAGGRVTNIGKDCGKTHFGVDFVEMSRAFERDDRNRQRREDLQEFKSKIPMLRASITALRDDGGGDNIYKRCHKARAAFPEPIRDALSSMIRQRDGRLIVTRRETQEEAEIRELTPGRDQSPRADDDEHVAQRMTVREQAGFVAGLDIFDENFDLRELLVLDVLPNLRKIEELFIPDLSERDLREHTKWATGVDEKLKRAERAIEQGRAFLQRSNLEQLKRLVTENRGARQLKVVIDSYALG